MNLPIRASGGPGGLRLLVREDPTTPITAVCLTFLGGQRLERRATQGWSQLTQRLLMQGTLKHSGAELAEAFESLGAHVSPFASKDLYGFTLAVLTRNFPEALGLLAECLMESSFQEVDKERRNQLLDLDRRQDDPLRLALEASESLMFPSHPYGYSLLGTPEALADLDSDKACEWHRRLATPRRGVLSVVGDLRVQEVREQVLAALEPLAAWPEPARQTLARPPQVPAQRRRRVYKRPKQEAMMVVALPAPAFAFPDFPACQVVHHLLAGLGGRLYAEIREKRGLAYLVDAGLERRVQAGLFRIYLGTSPDLAKAAETTVCNELRKLCEEPVSPREIRQAQSYARGLAAISHQKKSAAALQLAFHELIGTGYRSWRTWGARLRAVTSEDVQRVAREWFDPARAVCVHVRPQ